MDEMIRVHQSDVVGEIVEQDQPYLCISDREDARNNRHDVLTVVGGVEQPLGGICNMIELVSTLSLVALGRFRHEQRCNCTRSGNQEMRQKMLLSG